MEFENYKLLSYKSVAQFSNNITFSYYYYKLMLIVKNLDGGELPLRIIDAYISSGWTGRDDQQQGDEQSNYLFHNFCFDCGNYWYKYQPYL